MTVSRSGRGWKLAPSLIALEAEADRLAPRRSRASDGSIGDAAHRASVSDHNPAAGWVTAIDLTHDPKGGFDAHAHARAVAARRDPRVKYIISEGRIWTPAKGWTQYLGSNRHDHHAHYSILNTPAARDDTRPWLSFPPPPPRPPTGDEIRRYAAAVLWNYVTGQPNLDPGVTGAAWAIVRYQEALNLVRGINLTKSGVYDQPTIDATWAFQQDVARFTGKPVGDFPGAAGPWTRWMLAAALANIRDGKA